MIAFTFNVRGGKALPLTLEELKRCRNLDCVVKTSDRLAEITRQMKTLSNSPIKGENLELYKQLDAEKKQIKISRPALLPHAQSFDGFVRKSENAHPSGLVFFDLDHISGDVREWYKENVENSIERLGVVLAEISASGDGFHALFKKPAGMTISEAQQWFAKELGVKCDEATFDLARACFMVPESYVLYQNDEELFTAPIPDPSPLMGKGADMKEEQEVPAHKETDNSLAPGQSEMGKESEETKAEPFALKCWELCMKEAGLTEKELDIPGVRNWHNSLKSILSVGICQLLDEDQLRAVVKEKMPNYASEPDSSRLISDFYKNYVDENGRMSLTLRNIYAQAMKSLTPDPSPKGEGDAEMQENINSPLPLEEGQGERLFSERLPRLLQLLVKAYPEDYRPAVIMSSLVFLGALMTKVRAIYLDGSVHSCSFLGCVVAPQASGKSFTRRLYEIITAPIKAADMVAREIERKYNDARKNAKNRRDQPEDPKVKIRLIPATASNAMILKRADYANGEHLVTYAEEIDTLTKGKKAGAWSEKSDLYRMAFDNAEWGQDYMSDNSYSGQVKLFYNLLVCGTPNAVNRFFNDVEDGLVSRVMFMNLPDMMGCKMPKFGTYSHRDIREINSIIQKIYNDNSLTSTPEEGGESDGLIWVNCSQLSYAVEKWLEERRLEYLQNQDNPALEIFRRRAGVIGFRAGLVAYVLNGSRYSGMVSEFALWVCNFVLRNQLLLFGERMNQVMNKVEENNYQAQVVNIGKTGRNNNIFSQLRNEFTESQVVQIRMSMGFSSRVNYIISRWYKNGLIEPIAKGEWRKLV